MAHDLLAMTLILDVEGCWCFVLHVSRDVSISLLIQHNMYFLIESGERGFPYFSHRKGQIL
jgi:hypothetical protein